MLLDIVRDDLITAPLDTDPAPLSELVLPAHARPIARFELRAESFGWLLIRGGQVQPVSASAGPLLDVLNGCLTLAEITNQFGEEGLALVGQLVRKGLVALEDP
jgi:hypothetical protein